MDHARTRWGAVAFALIAVSACTDGGGVTDPRRSADGGPRAVPDVGISDVALRGLLGSADDRFIDIANEVPGFGGMVVEVGAATVYLTDVRAAAAAQRALAPLLREMEAADARVDVRQGDYDWRQLMRWRRDVASLMHDAGVVLVDTDERLNRVRVGVIDATAEARVRAALPGLGVPDSAVVVEHTAPATTVATLQDFRRPALAGTQIAFGQFLCTLGVNTMFNNVRSFITASHCSNVQGGVEGTIYYQPTVVTGNRIGVELADPAYTTGGSCPAGRRCRNSDAAIASYDASVTSDYGFLAQTVASPLYSLTIAAPPGDRAAIGGRDVTLTNFSGLTIFKIGRTTGRSSGSNTSSCVDVNVTNSTVTLFCQTMVSAAAGQPAASVGPGDSGSPAYRMVFNLSTGTTVPLMTGVLWGQSNNGTTFIFSPWKNIETDFGAPVLVK